MSKTFKRNDRGQTAANKALKEQSRKLRAKEREYCDRARKDPSFFDEEDVDKIDEVSNPWDWD